MKLSERIESTVVSAISGDIGIARPRRYHEPRLAAELRREGVGFFIPMQAEVRWQGKGKSRQRRTIYRRLLPGTIFIGDGVRGRDAADRNRRIGAYQQLSKGGLPRLRKELASLEETCKEEIIPSAEIAIGSGVRIIRGPLLGKVGRVMQRIDRKDKPLRFNVRLMDKICGSSDVDIDADLLEAV